MGTFILVVLAVMVLFIVLAIWQDAKRANMPPIVARSKVIERGFRDKMNEVEHFAWREVGLSFGRKLRYYVTFELENKEIVSLIVSADEYAALREGDIGEVAYRDTKFISWAAL